MHTSFLGSRIATGVNPAKEDVQERCIYFIFIAIILLLEKNILFSEQPRKREPRKLKGFSEIFPLRVSPFYWNLHARLHYCIFLL
jgi:hypothetical protein